MGENSEPLTLADEPAAIQQISNRRLLIGMAAIVIAGSAVGALFASPGFGLGVLLGGVMAFVNYAWLRRSIRSVFVEAAESGTSGSLAVKYILRYLLIGFVLTVIYVSDAVPVLAVILGMASFAFAVVLEGFIRIFSHSAKREF